jgi:hypothetical protein
MVRYKPPGLSLVVIIELATSSWPWTVWRLFYAGFGGIR